MNVEPKKEPKPLVMAEILNGTGLLDSSSFAVTSFTATITTGAVYNAQVAWLKKKLPLWGDLLATKSGTHPFNPLIYSNERRSIGLIDSGKIEDQRAKLVAHLWISGGINTEAIKHLGLRNMLAGQIKKVLATDIVLDFPPPFDYRAPSFAAGVGCSFFVRSFRKDNLWLANEIALSNTPKFRDQLASFLAGRSAELYGYSPLRGDSDSISLDCKFVSDITRPVFSDFKDCLWEFLRNNLSREVDVYDEAQWPKK